MSPVRMWSGFICWIKTGSRLYELAESECLWEQRIAMVSTVTFIRNREFTDTLALAEKLMTHKHDLMHKAVGWMLREVGKKDRETLTEFLRRIRDTSPPYGSPLRYRTLSGGTTAVFPEEEIIIDIMDNSNNEVLIYRSQDGTIKVDVLFEGETVWLTQSQLGTLFGKSKSTISEHIKNIFEEGELNPSAVVRNFRTNC